MSEPRAFLKDTGEEVEIIPSAKMSKSKKNVVDPMAIISKYGADTARWFVLSDSPPERDVEWTASGAEAAAKHLARVHRIATEIATELSTEIAAANDPETPEDTQLLRETHKAIQDVTKATETFGFNAAIARLYAFTSVIGKSKASTASRRDACRVLAKLMSPMTPHLSQDIWQMLDGKGLVIHASWPRVDEALLAIDTVTLVIQVNGKRRGEISVAKNLSKDQIESLALGDARAREHIGAAEVRRVIVVPGRIVNIVTG